MTATHYLFYQTRWQKPLSLKDPATRLWTSSQCAIKPRPGDNGGLNDERKKPTKESTRAFKGFMLDQCCTAFFQRVTRYH
mmetsp:Transcript_54835/g.108908  ORF Transcript_54835/g.108908 Transcript_54835/m.108908 type:complete len:80 (+) Transcript_54835:29-268(+)